MAKFRTKARAVELLGKGQIADLPTAISELWKNGYDAYADNLSCSLYLPGYKDNIQPIFTLADDGIGMSNTDLLEKWIVLGTDSKARGKAPLTSEQRLGKEPRIPMGEKGIGRLSVAYLGPQMLMLTKKKDENCQLLFLDWRVLDNYNLFIDDFEIPIEEFTTISEFDEKFDSAISQFKKNLKDDLWKEQKDLQEEIETDINKINVPTFVRNELIEVYTNKEKNGTCFIIFNPHEQLLELSDFIENVKTDKETIVEIRKSLSGLYNEFIGNRKFETYFYIFNKIGKYNLLDDFFTPDDLELADHYIKGKFDENGFFNGEVRVFNEIIKHIFKPTRPPGKTPYGKFSIELGVLEGEPKSSKLTEEEYRIIRKKLNLFSGLYLYRDDFRVLPYGRTEYDFLTFEERRSSSAGYYFFSQRNMYGYISISRDANSNLRDKAGREGLIANQAYREFKDDLIQFFKDLSINYFKSIGKDETDSNLRNDQLLEIKRKKERLLEAEKKKSKQTKKKFTNDLKENTPKIESLETEIEELYTRLTTESSKAEIMFNEYENLTTQLEDKKNKLRELKLQKPYRAELTSSQEKKFQEYQTKYSSIATKAEKCEFIAVETRKRFDIQNLKNAFMKRYNFDFREIHAQINSFKSRFSDASNEMLKAFDEEKTLIVDDYKAQLNKIPIDNLNTKDELAGALSLIEKLTNEFKDNVNERFTPFINHIESLNFDIDDDYLVGWYKEQNDNIEKKLQETNELAQLGMSIEIIDHQFNVMYSHITDSLSYFKNYVVEHQELEYQFEQLNTAFQHLEHNHRLLFPLYKTSRRSRTIITGKNIKEYLHKFFGAIFTKNKIKLSSDVEFDKYEYFTFESIIKPVFINVINNAVYWLTSSSERRIHLSVRGDKVLILNNGEKIDDRYLEDIFTLFFSRKRDGRGIGLYLARTNLRSIGFDISASNDKELNLLKGACFIIQPIENN